MKKINLFEIGRAFNQRAYRDPTNAAKAKALDLARELWHTKKTKAELLSIIAQLKEVERTFSGIRVYYADVAEKAVRSGNYSVVIPHEISHRYNEQPGRVYILTAPTRRGECKLGATTLHMFERCVAYTRKYGYRVDDWFHLETRSPFAVEKTVAAQIGHLRVCGNVKGDSIEWYRIVPDELKHLIINADRDMRAGKK